MDKLYDFCKYTTKNLNINICRNNKFKTNLIQIYIVQPLNIITASKNALIPYVLNRGSDKFPDNRRLILKLDELYGANLSMSVLKRGENQIIKFSLEIVNEKYLPHNEFIFEEGLELLNQLLFNPLLENSSFKNTYVEQEKNFLKDEIEGLINDKGAYAVERCYQEMCKNESFGIFKLGDLNSLKNIDSINLYEHYNKIIKNSPINIFFVGDLDEKYVLNKIKKYFTIKSVINNDLNSTYIKNKVNDIKEVIEKLDVSQGKLCLGYRTGISRADELYYALLFYNGILGSFPHSKLFQNVREKSSLAYYANSRLESTKGLLLISSGIDVNNYERARDLIIKQTEDIAKAKINSREFEWTKKGIINQFKSIADSNTGLIASYFLSLLNRKDESIYQIIDKLNKVSIDEIVEVANKVKLDTIYFLKNKGEKN